MTERLHFDFSLSCIGEGNGNPLQCSCLENPRDGRARWAAVHGVAQSRTRLKRLSSSSSSSSSMSFIGFLWWCSGICLQCRRHRFDPWVRKIPWRRKWQPTQVFLTAKSHRQMSLVGYSPWGGVESMSGLQSVGWARVRGVGYSLWECKESDMTKQPGTNYPE